MSQKPTTTKSLKDYPETKRIHQRVYTKLTAESKSKTLQQKNLAFKLTGLRLDVLQILDKTGNVETLDLTNKPIDRSDIHKQLFKLYSEDILPTTKQLFHALAEVLPVHMDIASFRKLLYRMDYVWKKLENNLFVVLERPEVTYERYIFLKQILEYGEKNVPIYFVNEWAVPFDPNLSFMEACDTTGKEKIVFAFSKSEVVFKNSLLPYYSAEIEYKDWIAGELIPTLEKESVIVVNTDYYSTDLLNYPTINSLKVEMTDWLDRHEVPYDANMSKIDLWSLIEKCTDIDNKTTTLDDLIRSSGHIPMRVPRHLHLLTPGAYLYENMKDHKNVYDVNLDYEKRLDKIHTLMKMLHIALLETCFETGFMKYKSLLNDDILLDEKLNALMEQMGRAEAGSDCDSDVPVDSD